jgi:hypothetical protein
VRQAIFGNVGTMVVFRLGVEDANVGAREMGVFTAEEILNLEMGQALARGGTSASAFNLQTYPPPPEASPNYIEEIIESTRKHYASPIQTVEEKLGKAANRPKNPNFDREPPNDASDPNEDDFTN